MKQFALKNEYGGLFGVELHAETTTELEDAGPEVADDLFDQRRVIFCPGGCTHTAATTAP